MAKANLSEILASVFTIISYVILLFVSILAWAFPDPRNAFLFMIFAVVLLVIALFTEGVRMRMRN